MLCEHFVAVGLRGWSTQLWKVHLSFLLHLSRLALSSLSETRRGIACPRRTQYSYSLNVSFCPQHSTALPQELGPGRAHFYDAPGQPLPLHHGGHGGQTVSLHQPAGHPRRRRTLSGRHYDAQAVVTATAHGPSPCVHHETDQEAEETGHDQLDVNIETTGWLRAAELGQNVILEYFC